MITVLPEDILSSLVFLALDDWCVLAYVGVVGGFTVGVIGLKALYHVGCVYVCHLTVVALV